MYKNLNMCDDEALSNHARNEVDFYVKSLASSLSSHYLNPSCYLIKCKLNLYEQSYLKSDSKHEKIHLKMPSPDG